MRKLMSLLFVFTLFIFTPFVLSGCGEEGGSYDTIESTSITEPDPIPQVQNCAWWTSLGQQGRNDKIVLEALYAVDQQIWDQNDRLFCVGNPQNQWWNWYLLGTHSCGVSGDWDYSNRSDISGWGGQCKPFVREILERASGGAATLPGGNIYDYRCWYPYRNRQDAILYAQSGEILQFTGSLLHTGVIITNFHDGRFEVVDSNWNLNERIKKHVINVNVGSAATADLKSYVIVCAGSTCN